jgi:hypothetical protein
VGEAQAAAIRAVVDRLDAGDGSAGEERDQVVGGELRGVWEVGDGSEHRLGGEVGSVAGGRAGCAELT